MSLTLRRREPMLRRSYAEQVLSIFPRQNIVAFWPLYENRGAVIYDHSGRKLHGAYTTVGFGTPGIDGLANPLWDGTTSYGNVLSAGLTAAFNAAEGGLGLFAKPSSTGTWTDGEVRRLAYFAADGNNYVQFQRPSGGSPGSDNRVLAIYNAGATANSTTITGVTGTGWRSFFITWSVTNDQVITYYKGVPFGSPATGLGTWVGGLATALLGALNTTPIRVWDGWLACACLIGGIVPTATQVRDFDRLII